MAGCLIAADAREKDFCSLSHHCPDGEESQATGNDSKKADCNLFPMPWVWRILALFAFPAGRKISYGKKGPEAENQRGY
jgi:hypothetical protein